MKKYSEVFPELRRAKRAALIPFMVIGDPDFETSLSLIRAAVEAGADVLELGIPFSDPIADGPTIQKADIRSAGGGMTVERALEFLRRVRSFTDVPIGLLVYYNLVCRRTVQKFFADCAQAGVNSVLVADLSIDDADEITPIAAAAGLDTVFMVTPNTATPRLRQVAAGSTGFIYAVSLLGVTGSRDKVSSMAGDLIGRLKGVTDVPVCMGFGISSPRQAAEIASQGADGVIIGSRIVQLIEDNLGDAKGTIAAVSSFVKDVRASLD